MALWDKLKQELDRAGRVAQDAIDEGRVKIDLLRARQLADKAAQALGYAVYQARAAGGDVDADTYARLAATLAGHETEVKRLEEQLERGRQGEPADVAPGAAAGGAAAAAAAATEATTEAATPPAGASTAPPASARADAPPQSGAGPGTPPSAGTAPEEPWSPTI